MAMLVTLANNEASLRFLIWFMLMGLATVYVKGCASNCAAHKASSERPICLASFQAILFASLCSRTMGLDGWLAGATGSAGLEAATAAD